MGLLLTIGLLTLAWAVATCLSNCEGLATRGLERQGVVCYHPRFRAHVATKVVRPLFPGYLFVQWVSGGWRSVLGTRGVTGLIMNDGRPVLLSDSVVDGVRDLEGREGLVELPDPFRPGVRVRVARGSLADFEGVCDTVDERRVFVLLQFLGSETRARFKKADLVLA